MGIPVAAKGVAKLTPFCLQWRCQMGSFIPYMRKPYGYSKTFGTFFRLSDKKSADELRKDIAKLRNEWERAIYQIPVLF
jgi:hypothetical protein